MKSEKLVVCLITGPAGAGKSSVSKELAKKFEKSAVIDVDYVSHMVIRGRVRPWPWNEEVGRQTSLAAKNACMLANNFLQEGYNVIINDVIGRTLFKQYQESFPKNELKVFLLLPTLEKVLERFDGRGVDDDLRKRTPELHEKFTKRKEELDWQVVDSTNHTLEETTDEIFKELTKNI